MDVQFNCVHCNVVCSPVEEERRGLNQKFGVKDAIRTFLPLIFHSRQQSYSAATQEQNLQRLSLLLQRYYVTLSHNRGPSK